jgi:hypothetical protein
MTPGVVVQLRFAFGLDGNHLHGPNVGLPPLCVNFDALERGLSHARLRSNITRWSLPRQLSFLRTSVWHEVHHLFILALNP